MADAADAQHVRHARDRREAGARVQLAGRQIGGQHFEVDPGDVRVDARPAGRRAEQQASEAAPAPHAVYTHAEHGAVRGRRFGPAAQVDVAGDLAVRVDRQPEAAPPGLADRHVDALDERDTQSRGQARLARRDRLEQRRAVRAVVAQVVVQVGEERRQVGFTGRADRQTGRVVRQCVHSARAIRIFWMSLVPS